MESQMDKMDGHFMRRVDAMGRVVIPKTLRDALDIQPCHPAEMYVRDGCLVIQGWTPGCIFCNETTDLSDYRGKLVCTRCKGHLRQHAGSPASSDRRRLRAARST